MSKTVAVLMGGWSSEREVSLVSGNACVKALEEQGYKVHGIDVRRDLKDLLAQIEKVKPAVVFNALHGRGGEDGCIQGVLEILGIPYTHSGVLASALAMDKAKAKEIFRDSKIPCPRGLLMSIGDIRAGKVPFKGAYVIKPNAEGSSVGVYIVKDGNLPDLSEWEYPEALVEEYIPGRELSVAVRGVCGQEAIGFTVTEIKTDLDFYNYEAKYSSGGSYHVVPAEIPSDIFVKAIEYAELAHKKLGCSGVSRSDFRYNNDEDSNVKGIFILEVNTQPGMTPTSLVPEQAAYTGMSFGELVKWMVENAGVYN